MGRRPLLVMVLGWFAVVGAVGAITFVVVSNAGSGVGRASAAERVVVVAPGESASPTVTSPPTPTPTPSVTPTASDSPEPSDTPEPSRPAPTPAPRPSSKAPRPSTPAVDPRTASFTTDGGIVVASCEDSRIVLNSIRPRDGWSFKREFSRGSLEVTFTASEREVEIYLRCVDDVPTRLKAGGHSEAGDRSSSESPSRSLVRPGERVQSEGLEHATPTASSTPPSTEETPHG